MICFDHLIVIAAILGPLSHQVWFRHGEHDFYSRFYVLGFVGLEVISFWALSKEYPTSAALVLTKITASYMGGLFTSILLYRAFFHPLRRFPGPLAWKITKFTQVAANQDFHGWKHIYNLHQQYGSFVRTGPNELSIIDPAALQAVLGVNSQCKKAAWYQMSYPLLSMHQTRDKPTHDKRRRIWDHAFSAKSLRNYNSRVEKYADELITQLERFSGGPVNVSKWYNYYSFDVMGDLAFGKSFDMLTSGSTHSAIKRLQIGMSPMSFAFAVPWLFWILIKIPFLAKGYYEFIAWSEQQALERKQMKVEEPDVMHWILKSPPMSNNETVNHHWLAGDSRLLIVAGSDTTASTLCFATRELLRNPECIKKLRLEIDPLISDGINQTTLQQAPYLNSLINETLRLHPPVPSVLLRVAPPQGLDIGEFHVPGNTIINIPLFSLHRSEEAFIDATMFIPERWTSRPDLVKDKRAFAPFSLGPFNCIGKNLALMEVRTVLSRLFYEFDISFAPNEDGRSLVEDSKEHFTLSLADMNVCFTPRKWTT